MWVPHRCELPSCTADKDAPLSRCGKCHIVLYCCREHQQADWRRHKVECAHISTFGLTPRVYKVHEELVTHPLGCPTLPEPPVGTKPSCGICGRTKPLRRTRCCNNWVCDRDDEYQVRPGSLRLPRLRCNLNVHVLPPVAATHFRPTVCCANRVCASWGLTPASCAIEATSVTRSAEASTLRRATREQTGERVLSVPLKPMYVTLSLPLDSSIVPMRIWEHSHALPK